MPDVGFSDVNVLLPALSMRLNILLVCDHLTIALPKTEYSMEAQRG
jgi:hypothetical protein